MSEHGGTGTRVTVHKTTEHHSKALVRKPRVLTLADLTRMQEAGAQNSKRPASLPLSAIEVAPSVFQWRLENAEIYATREHIAVLVGALTRTDNPAPLDPILVMAVGHRYVVIDGHCRLEAYRVARWAGGVPVVYFEGSIHDAEIMALEANTKDKLPMGKETKLEAAWKHLVRGRSNEAWRYTQAEISERTTVGLRTVKRMAAALKKHGDGVSTLTWAAARRVERDAEFKADDDWKEKKARKLAKQLAGCDNLTKDPEITASALTKVSAHLPKMLVSEWQSEATDMVLELLRENHPDEADRLDYMLTTEL